MIPLNDVIRDYIFLLMTLQVECPALSHYSLRALRLHQPYISNYEANLLSRMLFDQLLRRLWGRTVELPFNRDPGMH